MKLKKLIAEGEIKEKTEKLAKEITKTFNGEPITVISLLKGAFIFTADILRNLKNVEAVEFVRVKSYSGTQKKETKLHFPKDLTLKGKNVLILDDIFDTGESLETVVKEVEKQKPKKLKTCVLLDKQVEKNVDIYPDFVGFKIPDKFVVGYGLDYNELFRELPYVAYIEGDEDGQG
ncbi:hypoxanthine phosphoribosyltransferase [Desulfurobacterium pacificum]|uniref:Hypoxanthine phosphoribosyltransferase n=1 Tax=Desulfurobacterium pacificum TaxID=240166 RepID=A0ABY1NKC5_9BACT|nr:hypoxanthine phosphoribosyltransferase [Desulfurobacterium pacificum]SMP11193.1 hypoxanthine phosphoribosyltransferase [Desulfurobacterium pacificum]